MHHFVFHSRLRHAWVGRVLETTEHFHLRANSVAVEFQCLFAATVEKQIWLHRHIRVTHTHSLEFVWLNVNVPLPIQTGPTPKPKEETDEPREIFVIYHRR